MFQYIKHLYNSPELSYQERINLIKRGFYAKELIKFSDLLQSFIKMLGISIILIPVTVLILLVGGFGFMDTSNFLGLFLGPGILLLIYLIGCIGYIFLGKVFYSEEKVLLFGKVFSRFSDIPLIHGIYKILSIGNERLTSYILMTFPVIFVLGTLLVSAQYDTKQYLLFIKAIMYIVSLPLIPYILRQLVESLHPIYAFGNLGEKIQKLTPTVESKSKEIEENFEKDMNFRILSEGFDSLSSTFSEIVRLVINLEQVEKKANKGNLFDSEKYINSLRGDILTPLQSLKSFLEEQREKLRESQKELQKVRVKVGGSDELTSESILSSKRGESLMVELDENISKLEEMISKMS